MRFAYYLRQFGSKPHEGVMRAIKQGAERAGDEVIVITHNDTIRPFKDEIEEVDALILWGIGGGAKQVHDAYKSAGKRIIILDKPYTRGGKPGLLRISIDNLHPTAYFRQIKRKPGRWADLQIPVKPLLQRHMSDRGLILFDGASNKYCLWHNLNWPEWGQYIANAIAENTKRPIIYRPRPSHNPPPRVEGAELSERPLDEDFMRAGIVVSHGGNIGYDAIVRGIPHFAIADSAARSVSETDWSKLNEPYILIDEQRMQWLYDLAWCQWTLDEFKDGSAWRYVRETLDLAKHIEIKQHYEKVG